MKIAGTPVEGAGSWLGEIALLLADAAASEARSFVRVRALEAEIADVERTIATVRQDLVQRSSLVGEADTALAAVSSAPLVWAPRMVIAHALAGGVAVLGLALLTVSAWLGFGVLVAAAAPWSWVRFQRDRERARRDADLSAARTAHTQADGARAAATEALTAAEARRAELLKARDEARPRRGLKAVGRVYYPVTTVDLGGYPLLVDRGGTAPRVPLRLPDLAADPERLARIRRSVERARAVPVLLESREAGPSEVGRVHGEELDLRAAVTEFTEMVETIPAFEERLPLLRNDAPVAHYLEAHQGALREQDAPGLLLRAESEPQDRAALQRVGDLARRLRGVGRNVDQVLREVHRDLTQVLGTYQGLRTAAVGQLHAGLQDVMHRSDMAYVNCYCPRCNRVPAYLFHRLGVDLETAHTLPSQALLAALQDDDETRQRLTTDEQLMADLAGAWNSLRELDADIAHWEQQLQAGAGRVGADLAELRAFESRLRALRSQRVQVIEQFRGCLRKAVAGDARPLLELSRQARLHLDPEREVWTCAACNTAFDDPAVARMGRMLKIKDELFLPLWNHLWTEKDDLRKTELFRTNEQVQRLIEKEAAALRDVAEQYRADMRPVRENLILASMDAMTRKEQLETTVQSLSAMGVVSEEEAEASLARLGEMTGGDLGELRKRAEVKETLLATEPQAQMNRRPPAVDPVQVFRTPEALYRHDRDGAEIVRLRDTAAR